MLWCERVCEVVCWIIKTHPLPTIDSSSSPSRINNKRGAMALSTWGIFRFLLFFSMGFLVLGTLQGKVMAKKFAYMNQPLIFGVVICC